MANPTMTLIASNTAGSGGVSSVTFSSIPATYTDLIVKGSVRSNYAAVNDNINVTFNGSSTAVYSSRYLAGNGASASSASTSAQGAIYGSQTDGNTATASTFGNYELYIPNYTSATNKSTSEDSVGENNAATALSALNAGLWANTAAITSVTLTPGSGTLWLQYSTFYLYGIKNS
jgi:hypothetical protein